jgi:hypothetical protein
MKRGHGLARTVPPIKQQELQALPTGALVARLKRLRWCEEARADSDLTDQEVASVASLILFKEDPAWRIAYADLKHILADREHVENKT